MTDKYTNIRNIVFISCRATVAEQVPCVGVVVAVVVRVGAVRRAVAAAAHQPQPQQQRGARPLRPHGTRYVQLNMFGTLNSPWKYYQFMAGYIFAV